MISEQGHVRNINTNLKVKYGTNLRGQAMFRVVWTTNQTEKRFGTFEEHVGKIYLRTVTGLQEVPKYAWVKDRWILEHWVGPEKAYTREIPATAEGSYEPLWAFQHADGRPVPVEERIVHHIIHDYQNPPLPGSRQSDLRTEEKRIFDREVANTVLHLEEVGSASTVFANSII